MNAFIGEAGGDFRGDMRTGFASIGADQHARMLVQQAEIAPYAAAGPVKGLVVQGIFAGNSPDAVSSKQFFGHLKGSVSRKGGSRA